MESTPTEADLGLIHESFIIVKWLVDSEHFFRYILKCNVCGQLYFFEFHEEIDWVAGNDPQYTTYIPVNSIEEAEELNKKNQLELLMVVPRLQADFPLGGDKTIHWVK